MLQYTDKLIRAALRPFGRHREQFALAYLSEVLAPTVNIDLPGGRSVQFYCPGPHALYRADTLLTKEPDTIHWIDSFSPGEILWDIGANVGVYTLYAAIRSQATVLAFEPSHTNYRILNRNILVNRLSKQVSAYCLAFGKDTKLAQLFSSNVSSAGPGHALDAPVGPKGRQFEVLFEQGIMSYSIDQFMSHFAPPVPNHIKIDVDGIEEMIVSGAERTLMRPELKSLLIEINPARGGKDGIRKRLSDAGFRETHHHHRNHTFRRA